MIAIDTNILVYSRRPDSPNHAEALRILKVLAEGHQPWAIPWPCVYEFLRVVTHPKFFPKSAALDPVFDDLASLLNSPTLVMLGEGPAHFRYLQAAVGAGNARGNLAFDAHIAALAIEHGVTELWTADRDFRRFPGLTIRNPFVASDEVHEVRVRYRPRAGVSGAAGATSRRPR